MSAAQNANREEEVGRQRVAMCQRCRRTDLAKVADGDPTPFGNWMLSDDGRHLCPDCVMRWA